MKANLKEVQVYFLFFERWQNDQQEYHTTNTAYETVCIEGPQTISGVDS